MLTRDTSHEVTDPMGVAPCAVCRRQSHCECWDLRFCYPCFARLDRVLPMGGAEDDRYRSFVARWAAAQRAKQPEKRT